MQLAGDARQIGHGVAVEMPVVHLQAAQPELGKLLDQLSPLIRVGEVGQRGQTARGSNGGDGLHRAQTLARHVSRLAARQEPLHGIVHGTGVSSGDDRASDLRPAERGSRGGSLTREQLVHFPVYGKAQLAKAIHDPVEARDAKAALLLQNRLERLVVDVDAEAQDVEFAFPELRDARGDAVDLNAGQQLERQRRPPGSDEFARTGEGVVVGQGQDLDSHGRGGINELERFKHTVGSARVRVEVHSRRVRGHHGLAERLLADRAAVAVGPALLGPSIEGQARPRRCAGFVRSRRPCRWRDRRRSGRR